MSFLKSAADLILEPSETSGADVPAVKESPDEQALLLLNDVFDALVEACPLDFVDNWIRQIQAAVILGWVLLGQRLSPLQVAGIGIVIASIWLSQHAQRGALPTAARPATR